MRARNQCTVSKVNKIMTDHNGSRKKLKSSDLAANVNPSSKVSKLRRQRTRLTPKRTPGQPADPDNDANKTMLMKSISRRKLPRDRIDQRGERVNAQNRRCEPQMTKRILTITKKSLQVAMQDAKSPSLLVEIVEIEEDVETEEDAETVETEEVVEVVETVETEEVAETVETV